MGETEETPCLIRFCPVRLKIGGVVENFDKSLTFGHLQASLHGTRSIAILDKSLTLGHLQASLHGTRSIAIFRRFQCLCNRTG
jgi:hypothetical protein